MSLYLNSFEDEALANQGVYGTNLIARDNSDLSDSDCRSNVK